jgi:hypothetical protein
LSSDIRNWGQFTLSPDSDIALVATRPDAASSVSRAHRRSIWLNDARLDDGAARRAGQQALGPDARRSTAAEGAGARAAEAAAARESARLLGVSERLGDERLCALRPLGVDAAGTDAGINVPRHGRAPNTSRKLQQSQ